MMASKYKYVLKQTNLTLLKPGSYQFLVSITLVVPAKLDAMCLSTSLAKYIFLGVAKIIKSRKI